MKKPCRKCAPKANSRPLLILVNNLKQYVLIRHPYVTRMYSHVICMSLVCTHVVCTSLVCIRMPSYVTRMYFYVIGTSLVCTRMSSVCDSYVLAMSSVRHWYELVCHPYVTRMYSYVICMSLVCTRMSSVCHSYVLVCHLYVTRMWFYYEPLITATFKCYFLSML